jgi:hypothetical protein
MCKVFWPAPLAERLYKNIKALQWQPQVPFAVCPMSLISALIPTKWRWSLARRRAWRRYHADAANGDIKARAQFQARHRYAPDFAAPRSHSERVYLRKLRDHDPRYPVLTDKVTIRRHVDAVLGKGSSDRLCVPIIAQAARFADLPDHVWDQDVILKCTHGSGMNIVVRKGDTAARRRAARKIRRWLGQVHGARRFEWAYFDLTPSVIAEPLLGAGKLRDVKLYYYDGILRFVMPEDNSAKDPAITVYTPDWQMLDMTWAGFTTNPCEKPAMLDAMIAIATPLAQGFDMIRVDFLEADDRFYLGEMTLYDGSGLARFDTPANDRAFAQYWQQPHLGVDGDQNLRNASCTAVK